MGNFPPHQTQTHLTPDEELWQVSAARRAARRAAKKTLRTKPKSSLPYKKRNNAKQPEGHKYCGQCGVTQSLTEFHKHKNSKDGRQWRCKTCVGNSNRTHYPPRMTGFKECITCQQIKPFTVYGVDPRNKNGRKGRCDVCEKDRHAEWWQERGKLLWAERKKA